MKKRSINKLLLCITLLILLSTNVYATNGFMNVKIDNRIVAVRQVPVLLDGEELQSDVPSFIYEDRTLVPVRFIAENYGAEVDWRESTKTAIILHNGKEIELTINSNIASINGSNISLDNNSIPRLAALEGSENANTMVPLAFISDVLGYEYGSDEDLGVPFIKGSPTVPEIEYNNTITDISLKQGSTSTNKIVVESENKLESNVFLSDGGKKLTFHIEDTKLDHVATGDQAQTKTVNDENIEYITYSQEGSKVILEVILKRDTEYKVSSLNSGRTNVINFTNRIGNIKIDGKSIIVENAGNLDYKTMELSNPKRFVIDLLDASISSSVNLNEDLSFISSVRSSQFTSDNNYTPYDKIVRVVLDVKNDANDPELDITTNGNDLVITPKASIWDHISKKDLGNERTLVIKNDKKTEFKNKHYESENIVEFIIPKEATNILEGEYKLNDRFIDNIKVSKDEKNVKVRIKYKSDIELDILTTKPAEEISVKLKRKVEAPKDLDPSKKTIVIDPGHGGRDGGASGNGFREKDLALAISKETAKSLEDAGYNVLMTRDTDEYIALYDRSGLANQKKADLFVSIHLNSVGNRNPQANGIETLYCPALRGVNKSDNQYPFAEIIQEELIRETGATDRGVKSRPDLAVLRTTEMPAVLVEAGFMTNPTEVNKLNTKEYQQSIARAITNAINRYFEEY